jgi:hypothetical protein
MSDFLGNLAMKSLGLAPLVQPRPLSPFEALPAGGAFAGRLAAESQAGPVEILTGVINEGHPAPVEVPSARLGRLNMPRAPVERSEGAQPVAVSVPPVMPQAEAPGPDLGRAPAPFEEVQPASTPAFEGARHAVPPSDLHPAPVRAAQHIEGAQPVAVPPPSPLPERAVAVSESQAEHPHMRRALTPVVEQIKASPGPSKTVAAQAESPAAPAEPAPTISVTIGRVEVRAALTPRPSPEGRRERRAAPSLDDYLRMRSGGKP